MIKEIKFQINNALCSPGFISVCILMAVFSMVCFIISCITEYKTDIISVAPANAQFFFNAFYNASYTRIFSVILPFAACAAYSDSYLSDYNGNRLPICLTRTKLSDYYFSKLIAVFFCGSFVILFPQVLNYILCMIAFPMESTNEYGLDLWQSTVYVEDVFVGGSYFLFKKLYIFSPYLYFIFYIIISGFVSGLIAVFAYQLSYFIKNRIFVLSFMFVAMNLSDALFTSTKFDINGYIFGCSVGGQTYLYFILTIAIYILLAALPTPFAIKRLKNCV